MKHSKQMWSVLVHDDDGPRFLSILGGIVTTKTRAEAAKALKQWQSVRMAYKPEARVVRVRVTEV